MALDTEVPKALLAMSILGVNGNYFVKNIGGISSGGGSERMFDILALSISF